MNIVELGSQLILSGFYVICGVFVLYIGIKVKGMLQ